MSYKGTIEFEAKIELNGFEQALGKLSGVVEDLTSGGFKSLGEGVSSVFKQVEQLQNSFRRVGKVSSDMLSLFPSFDKAKAQVDEYVKAIGGVITAQMLENGQLGVKEVLMGVLQGKIGLVTAAQWLWNAAVSANPIGAVVVVATAAITALVALAAAIGSCDPAYKKQSAAVKELSEAQKEFVDTTKSSQEAAEKSLASIGATAEDSRRLAATLGELSKGYDRAAGDEQRMAAAVAKLNEEQEGLNLTFDEQTGALSMTGAEIEKYIAAKEDMAKAEAYVERENELYKEQAEIAENLELIEQRRQEVEKETGGLQRLKLLEELNEAEEGYLTAREENAERLSIVGEKLAEIDTVASETILENTKAEQEAAEAAAQAAEEEMQRRQEAIASFTEAATNMFSAINVESDVSAAKMLENLQKNREAMENYFANMEELRERFRGLGIDDAVLEQFANMGTEGIAYVAALAESSDAQLKELAPAYAASVEAATAAGIASYQMGYTDIESAAMGVNEAAAEGIANSQIKVEEEVKAVVVNAKDAATAQVQESQFSTVGSQMMAGITNGIAAGKSNVVNAARDAVRAAMDAARREAEINSPSRKTRREIGRPFALGIGLGVEDEADGIAVQVTDTMQKLENAAQKGLLGKDGIQGAAQRLVAGVQLNHAQIARTMPQAGLFAMAGSTEAAAAGAASYTQNFNFYQPVETPDETARAIRLQTTYGLAGDVG